MERIPEFSFLTPLSRGIKVIESNSRRVFGEFMTVTEYREIWSLNPLISYINHGGFGACPKAVLEARFRWVRDFEEDPLRFVFERFEPQYSRAQQVMAKFVGADPDRLVFVSNATEGVNIVLKSLALRPGDRLLATNHAYPGCRAALTRAAERSGAEVVTVDIPFPLRSPRQAVDPILYEADRGARLALIDHVSSETALVFPVEEIVRGLADRGVDTIVDGAHAPGMLPLDADAIGAAWYAGNCHKWLCGPKSAGFLVSAPGRLDEIEPLVTSFGRNCEDARKSRRQWEFFWRGTIDASAIFVIPELIEYMSGLLPGGWPEIMRRNRALAIEGRRRIMERLGLPEPAPESMIGSMATLPLPDHGLGAPVGLFREDRLARRLYEEYGIEVPLSQWPEPGRFNIRISAQLYNSIQEYEALAEALRKELPAAPG